MFLDDRARSRFDFLMRNEWLVRGQRLFHLGAEPQVVGGGLLFGVELGDDRIELAHAVNIGAGGKIGKLPIFPPISPLSTGLRPKIPLCATRNRAHIPVVIGTEVPASPEGRQRSEGEEGAEGPISAGRRWMRGSMKNCPSGRWRVETQNRTSRQEAPEE